MASLAIDIGGTFTDVVVIRSDRESLSAAKVLTTYPDPSRGVLEGAAKALESAGVPPAQVERLIHGTTLVTNALIERKGARTGLLTTAGFRDALEIGREGRYDIYDLFLELPEPLVERRLRLEVRERLNARGEVLEELDETTVREACRLLAKEGVEAVAVCFLHSYANSDHERRAAAIASELLPGAAVSASHAVAPQMREYERASTTVANAYVKQLAGRYLNNLQDGMRRLGVPAPLHVTLSNGGTATAATAAEFPVRLVESGPCGGALAAAEAARRCGFEDLLAFDMGGTTAKAFLSTGGEFPITTESEVARVYRFKRGSGLPLLVPVLDMIEVGAGGGSIARIDPLGLPAVGPDSAGSSPGPACYGLGGELPTVTDADLLLGFLNPGFFLGGEMALDPEAAARAVCRFARGLSDPDRAGGHPAEPDTAAAAWGIHRLVNENMANAARVHAAERGLDVAACAMVATGGAGPVHACKVAELLGIETVIVPGAAGVSSAIGLLLAPLSFDFSQSLVVRLEEVDPGRVDELLAGLETRGRGIVAAGGVSGKQVVVVRTADMRYVGQGHEIRVPLPDGRLEEQPGTALQEAFDAEYRRSYGRICEGVPVEAIHWRVTVSGPRPRLQLRAPGSCGTPLKGEREVFFDGCPRPVPVFDRYALPAAFTETGPLIVEEVESTTVVPPGWSLSSTETGELLARRSRSRSA